MLLKLHPTHPTWDLQMIWLECENANEIAPHISVLLGWNLKGIRETFGVPIYDCQLAVCVSTSIESMVLEQELSVRVLVSSRRNLVAFSEYAWVGDCWWEGILWKMTKGYHVLLGWNLKGIRETFGVPIYDRQLAVCVSTPIESMILEWELSPRFLVSLRSKWRCNWNCTPLILHEICKWYDLNVKIRLKLHLKHMFSWGET